MGLFGAVVRTVVNTATLPVAVARDIVTLGGVIDRTDGKLHTTAHLERLKEEADDE